MKIRNGFVSNSSSSSFVVSAIPINKDSLGKLNLHNRTLLDRAFGDESQDKYTKNNRKILLIGSRTYGHEDDPIGEIEQLMETLEVKEQFRDLEIEWVE